MDNGYLMLAETIFMLLFNTFQYQGRSCRYGNVAGFELIASIRSKVELPTVPWLGMNLAIPMKQGFRHTSAKRAPCSNPACSSTATVSSELQNLPLGDIRVARGLLNPLDPLGVYICGCCALYQVQNGRLPDQTECEVLRARRIRMHHRASGTLDFICIDCGTKESEQAAKRQFDWLTSNDNQLEGYYCQTCMHHFKREGCHRPRASDGRIVGRKATSFERCAHCLVPHIGRSANDDGAGHAYNHELGKVLCAIDIWQRRWV
ncbi:hypothetical protein J1614_001503 [Plenodomus biglobosus]|nr:hypothetical protein J1614_001503 [Plenodomus biglobosus]